MGSYLNPGNEGFRKIINSDIYVDKTGMIEYTNSDVNTMQGYICVSRPRRFGKSIAANMLAAYYSRGCDSKELFDKYKIADIDGYETYLNKYDVIFLNMQEFLSQSTGIDEMMSLMQKSVLWELLEEYSDVRYSPYKKICNTFGT